jgi:endogenous inhibitor of DNA gyrase (YacG/DUF329 family)
MKTVTYRASDCPWVGVMQCPACGKTTPAWQSSGMSQAFPHFYCNRCSNVLLFDAFAAEVYGATKEEMPALLERIKKALPACPCGGRFTAGAGPKCAHCRAEFSQDDPVAHLDNPHLVALDGACILHDPQSAKPYRVRVIL